MHTLRCLSVLVQGTKHMHTDQGLAGSYDSKQREGTQKQTNQRKGRKGRSKSRVSGGLTYSHREWASAHIRSQPSSTQLPPALPSTSPWYVQAKGGPRRCCHRRSLSALSRRPRCAFQLCLVSSKHCKVQKASEDRQHFFYNIPIGIIL